jgi:hypothetical protein
LAKRTNYEAPHKAVLSNLLSFPPPHIQIYFFSNSSLSINSIYVSLFITHSNGYTGFKWSNVYGLKGLSITASLKLRCPSVSVQPWTSLARGGFCMRTTLTSGDCYIQHW